MAIEKTIILKADTKEATSGIKKLDDGVKGVDKSSKAAKTGLGKMSGATKMLGTAFKALGIGLIITAFMKLKDIFSGNIETARMFEKVMSQASAAFDVIRDRTESFIKALIQLKNPFKAFKDAFTGTTAEIRDEAKAMGELTVALQNVRDRERDMLTVRADANKLIAESRLLAEDESKSMEERLVALKAAVAEEQRVASIEMSIQEDKVNALQEIIDLGKSSEEDMQNLAAERARLTELETASILKQKRVVTEIVTFEKQIETARTNAVKKKKKDADDKLKADEKEAAKLQETTDKELELLRTSNLTKQEIELEAAEAKYTKLLDLANKYGQDTTQLTDKYNAEVLDINSKYAEKEEEIVELSEENKRSIVNAGVTAVIGALGEESKAAKALAVGQALINTYSAATAALAPPPVGAGPIFGPIAAGTAILSGLANVKKIVSTKLPGVTDSAPDMSSPDVPTTPQLNTSGGISGAIPNMDTIGPVSTAPVQAYVVENDISNAQALQEELEIQATL